MAGFEVTTEALLGNAQFRHRLTPIAFLRTHRTSYGLKTGFWILAADSAMKEGDAGMEHCPKSCFDAKSLLVETPVERRVRMSSAIAARLAPGFHATAR